jgi:hypothetical protein
MKNKFIFIVLFLLTFIIRENAQATFEPPFMILSKNHKYEIRIYRSIIVAETSVKSNFVDSSDIAFRILTNYFYGNNKTKSKLEVGDPVIQYKAINGYNVQFTMPDKKHIDTIPEPNNSAIKLKELAPKKVAVLTYSGSWSEERFQIKSKELKDALLKDGISFVGEPTFNRFNSPFQFWFLRRNEIWIEVNDRRLDEKLNL